MTVAPNLSEQYHWLDMARLGYEFWAVAIKEGFERIGGIKGPKSSF
jgi:hypothetical protein